MAKHNVQEHTLQAILWAVAQPWKVTAAYQPALQAKQKASARSHQKGGGLAGQLPASHEHATQPAGSSPNFYIFLGARGHRKEGMH
jgi:hypothetical protein